ncbi:hypothetical protein BS47DRAFT_1388383 [Hydnum rufescens UP504]|uniref:Uncharacterized protein n=1 Tax=Hydnum rufescens UP504 TaxID=1448309 RepID=A0A9P6E1C4_9AGAM|nr:hypothetical protein BS47DRAFT_1388383 [Hydnum rufescens UP504]
MSLYGPLIKTASTVWYFAHLPYKTTSKQSQARMTSNLSDYAQTSRNLQAVPNMSIIHFCEHVLSTPASAEYKIFSLGMYQEVRFTIKHTYILLGVQPSHGQLFYLRLNRAAGRDCNPWLRFRSVSSKFPPEDRVIISWNEDSLHTPPMNTLSLVTFQRDNPSLGELAILLNIMEEESTIYTVYPENCWFFCSVVQELFTSTYEHSGSVNSAFKSLSPKVRATIANRWATERTLRGCE